LFKKDNGVVALYAVDAVNCGTAMSRYDAKQEKEKQERDDAMRRNAIEAL